MKNATIVGKARWLPPQVRENSAWPASFVDRSKAGERTFNDIPPADDPIAAEIIAPYLETVERDPFMGAVRRHVAQPHETSVYACSEAAKLAIQQAGLQPSDIDMVICNSVAPDNPNPADPSLVAYYAGIRDAATYEIDLACASAIAQLAMAKAYIQAGMAKRVLLVQGHIVLRTLPFEHPAAPSVGDGASAMVVANSRSGFVIKASEVKTYGEYARAVLWVRDGDVPWWKGDPNDFRIGTRQPDFIKRLMRDTVTYGAQAIERVSRTENVHPMDLTALCSVQPRGYIPGCIAERVGMFRDQAFTTYEEVAHLGVCGPVFNLIHADEERHALVEGDLVGLYGQGAGFTTAAMILEKW